MKPSVKELIKSYVVITLGSIIYALAYDAFFAPNLVAMGGVTGLGQIINALCPFLTVGALVFGMNVPLFLMGWKYIGRHLLISSLYATALSSAAIDFFAAVYTFPAMDPMLASICGGATLGLGLGLVFLKGATTGGTDIIARLLKLKFTWLPIGNLILVPDFLVITAAAIVFRQLETALYGLIAVAGLQMLKKVDLGDSKNLFIVSGILVCGIGGLTFNFGFNPITNGPLLQITSLAVALIVGIVTNLIVNNGKLSDGEESDK